MGLPWPSACLVTSVNLRSSGRYLVSPSALGTDEGRSMAAEYEDEEWARAAQKNWRGLGLTDPIKSVEVCQ